MVTTRSQSQALSAAALALVQAANRYNAARAAAHSGDDIANVLAAHGVNIGAVHQPNLVHDAPEAQNPAHGPAAVDEPADPAHNPAPMDELAEDESTAEESASP
ncbi:hypothetical protein CF319_g6123 [Tilletia indica]|uniref:Uncharacterized protein n=1 Tax=Tilletia indica TaxID=43049 RepID=A0A177T4X3_9BASI|nr:hypothetical protein CF319_g6123 [Tilletia indica]KAE8241744.1 hypothetical protein A4X13_0g7281 [Tilletia indica]